MLQTVEFRRAGTAMTSISLSNPDPNGFTIREIRGLDAGAVDVHIAEMATMAGGIHNGSRKPTREIVAVLGYGDRLSPEAGRGLSYDLFPLGGTVTLRFDTGDLQVEIDGVVESNQAPLFTEDPAIEVVFLCARPPYFRSISENQTVTNFRSFEKMFEFPFSNESLTEKLLVMGEYTNDFNNEIYYDGSIQNGIIIELSVNGSVMNPMILHENSNTSMRIISSIITSMTGRAFGPGDLIRINTIRGSKGVTLIREGRSYNILNALGPNSGWIEFSKGINKVSVYADEGIEGLDVKIYNDTLYVGL